MPSRVKTSWGLPEEPGKGSPQFSLTGWSWETSEQVAVGYQRMASVLAVCDERRLSRRLSIEDCPTGVSIDMIPGWLSLKEGSGGVVALNRQPFKWQGDCPYCRFPVTVGSFAAAHRGVTGIGCGRLDCTLSGLGNTLVWSPELAITMQIAVLAAFSTRRIPACYRGRPENASNLLLGRLEVASGGCSGSSRLGGLIGPYIGRLSEDNLPQTQDAVSQDVILAAAAAIGMVRWLKKAMESAGAPESMQNEDRLTYELAVDKLDFGYADEPRTFLRLKRRMEHEKSRRRAAFGL